MFNTTHIHEAGRDRLVPYEKSVVVTEHRASTDKSVELLNEMRQKAEQNIINTIVIEDNTLKAVVIFFHHDILHDKVKYGLRYVLNGKEFRSEGQVDKIDVPYIHGNDLQTRYLVMCDFFIPLFSKSIAEELLKQLPESIINNKV